MKLGKSFTQKQMEAVRHLRNWLAHRGRAPSVRELMGALGYRSPRSAQDILEQLVEKRAIKRLPFGGYQLLDDANPSQSHAQTVDVPLIGVVAAGAPILAEENVEGFIPVSRALARPGSKYFLLRVKGDSMDEAGINEGDFVLVRQQPIAEKGEIVVALIDDHATVKEYHRARGAVVLKPRSSNRDHKQIILTEDFQIQGVVKATIPNFGE